MEAPAGAAGEEGGTRRILENVTFREFRASGSGSGGTQHPDGGLLRVCQDTREGHVHSLDYVGQLDVLGAPLGCETRFGVNDMSTSGMRFVLASRQGGG